MADNGKESSPYHQRGAETVRETAKWVAVALASIGAVIIAGVQLSDLRNVVPFDLPPDSRPIVALVGIVVGLGAVGWAIHAIANVLTPLHVTLERLKSELKLADERKFFAANPTFLRGFGSDVDTLSTNYERHYQAYVTARDADIRASTNETKAALVKAATELKAIHDTVLEVLRVASYEHIRRLFLSNLTIVFACAAFAALGGIAFAWATGEQKGSAFTTLQGDRATLELTASAAQKALPELGLNCDAKALDAVVLSETATALEVLVLPNGQCNLLRLTVPKEAGKLRGITAIDRKNAG